MSEAARSIAAGKFRMAISSVHGYRKYNRRLDPSSRENKMKLQGKAAIVTGASRGIANLIVFIVSPQGSLLHGALIDADGGATKTI
jgi:hypothetical protein